MNTPNTNSNSGQLDQAVTGADMKAALEGVSVFYGEVVGLSRVDLGLQSGITGMVGPNGSGKTTMMRVMVGLISPEEGRVRVLGRSPFLDAQVRARITFVPASENFYPGLSGRKNLEVAFMAQGRHRPEARDLAQSALELVGLVKDGRRRYGTWSRGMRQRLKLGLALAGDSDVVLLDEPFLGVDPPSRRALREHVLALGKQGRTVLVSSHVLHEVEALTDLVGILARGRLLGFGKVHTLVRKIRDDHPHRVVLHVDDPRKLGQALLGLSHIQELKVVGSKALEFVTVRPESAYRELPGLVLKTGVVVRRIESLDHSLEAAFAHVTAAGSRRL
ncbi:MAG: ATP-binding cassette domain-containing protein [Candidatus Latescibacteria bacterium]|nr:ATP-binding cassette domain-containing protein [Candidatus Latescibacterota bacterium]NIO57407.1 ATP-binding cassette domain-containing protein [Candidatus Latescibacterota bacterium]